METDLFRIRMNAHMTYLIPRIHNKKKLKEFVLTMLDILNDEFVNREDKHGGRDLAIDIYVQIKQIHTRRFDIGRSGDFMLEKI